MGTYAKQKKEEKKQKKLAKQAEDNQNRRQQMKKKQVLNGMMIGVGIVVVISLFRGVRTSSQSTSPTKEERRIAMETAACTPSLAGTTRYAGYGCYEYCNGKQREKKSGCSDSPDNSQYKSNQPCTGLPDNAQRNGASAIDQIWDGSKRYPTTTGRYNEEVSNGECTFSCLGGYGWDGNNCISSCIFTPGITHNTTAQTITIADCNNSYTIMDRNLGATQAGTGKKYGVNCSSYNDGTCIDESAGYYFQRGNNFGFPSVGTVSPTSSSQVNASSYGPSTYFSGTFILTNPRDSSDNRNLRGGSGDVANDWDDGNARTNRQGPCPAGYHVPSAGEWAGLFTVRRSINSGAFGGGSLSSSSGLPYISVDGVGTAFMNDIKLPLAGDRSYSSASTINDQGRNGHYWSSSPYPDADSARRLGFHLSYVGARNGSSRGDGLSVRCFKDV